MEEKDDNLMRQFASKYVPYWPLFLLAIAIAIGIAYAYIRYATPIYEATATVIIKDEKKGNEESKLVESLDQISSKKIVENEIEIIQSRKLMEDVVRALGLYAPIYEKGDVHDVLAYTKSPVSIVALFPDSLQYFKRIDLNYNKNSQQVILNHKYNFPLDSFVTTPFGRLKFVPNKYFISDTINKQLYFSLNQPKDLVPVFLSGLKAEAASKLSSIVDLSYRDPDPVRAENILNQLIESYQESANEEKDALAKNTLAFVNNRLALVSHDLDSIEKKVQQFKSGNQAVDISAQGQLYLQNVSVNDQKLGDVNTQIAVLDKVQDFVKSNSDSKGGIVPSTLGISDPQLSQLIDKLYNSELEYDNLKKTVGENNPSLVAIKDRINKIKPSILSNINSQRQSLIATRDNITTTNNTYNSVLQSVPQKERELLDISREQQIKSNLYSFLLQKKEESEIAYASSVSNSRVVDYAQASPDPVSPRKLLIYALSIVVFIGVCGTFIFIKEFLTGKVLYRHEIESLTSIPIIGEIAFDKSKDKIVIEKGTRSFVAEEFRKLRISLSFLGIDSSHKKILITSSISGEGKSFISANLAVSLSLTGKKVVLVDMDLNNPTLDKILSINREEGVTEFLEGDKDPEEIIKHVGEYENLFFISAGADLPENPSELLSNGKVNELLNYLENIFDYVLIDTSPMVLVTDGYLLTGLCDATLYVIRHHYTPKMLIKRIDENIHINPINNPAIIFNGVKMRGFFKNNYGYGYDYVYGNKDRKRVEKKPIVKY
ncbi:MAG: polysaccharide biosynthesis tyrosine autokinase [Bacteroidota bacterium]|nr:polysaccharide biosynthesis tyrosine autokinase [Bacteroidota bacterium]